MHRWASQGERPSCARSKAPVGDPVRLTGIPSAGVQVSLGRRAAPRASPPGTGEQGASRQSRRLTGISSAGVQVSLGRRAAPRPADHRALCASQLSPRASPPGTGEQGARRQSAIQAPHRDFFGGCSGEPRSSGCTSTGGSPCALRQPAFTTSVPARNREASSMMGRLASAQRALTHARPENDLSTRGQVD